MSHRSNQASSFSVVRRGHGKKWKYSICKLIFPHPHKKADRNRIITRYPQYTIVTAHASRIFTSDDHDVLDGAPAARFHSRLNKVIESGYGQRPEYAITRSLFLCAYLSCWTSSLRNDIIRLCNQTGECRVESGRPKAHSDR